MVFASGAAPPAPRERRRPARRLCSPGRRSSLPPPHRSMVERLPRLLPANRGAVLDCPCPWWNDSPVFAQLPTTSFSCLFPCSCSTRREDGVEDLYDFRATAHIDMVVDKENRKREAGEMGDAMRALEKRAMYSTQDMDVLAALEEMWSMKSRHAGVSINQMLEILKHSLIKRSKKQ